MENPLAIANYFIGKSGTDNVQLTPMKLIKLTYIAHGWFLALSNEPLINEKVEAWKYGPVIKSIYYTFKEFQNKPITEYAVNGDSVIKLNDNTLGSFLDKIWELYKQFSGVELSSLTHQANTPWSIITQDGSSVSTNKIIPDNVIKEHYTNKLIPAPQQ